MKKKQVLDFLKNRSRRCIADSSLKIPLTTVSGVATTKTSLVDWADTTIPALSLITTKSYQCLPNAGNREPVLCEMGKGNFGNSVGLRNSGMDIAVKELTELRKKSLRCFLIVSVSANTADDFITLVKGFDHIADIIELNFSCPHAEKGYGAAIGADKNSSSSIVRAIRSAVPNQESALFVKLTPNVPNVGEIAIAVCNAGCDGLSAINTVGPDIHIHEKSGMPILQNALGGKGGKSGAWVRKRAIEVVGEIRRAIGFDIPLIGMGGVESGKDVYALLEAGADAIGIGSALIRVEQKNWATYFATVLKEAQCYCDKNNTFFDCKSATFLNSSLQMEYKPLIITSIESPQKDTVIITVDKNIKARAGEFVFLWLPSIGEKPFSLAGTAPARFVIKKRGCVSKALCELKLNDTIYMRGIYGAPIQHSIKKHAYIFCGGTGIALAPLLCNELAGKSTITVFLGMSGEQLNSKQQIQSQKSLQTRNLFEDELSPLAEYHCVYDNGKIARVLDYIPPYFDSETALYIIGPTPFMKKGAEQANAAGLSSNNIYVSLEQNTMCGVGICGECAANHTLTCQNGTFFTFDFVQKQGIL